jgi:acetoin utilization deacetylase AcuC-like enzyme
MTTLYLFAPGMYHTRYGHPENAGRPAAVRKLLEQANILPDLLCLPAAEATIEQLARVHSAAMIERVREASALGGGMLDRDTYATQASYEAARLAVGACCLGVDKIMAGEAQNGFALVRPPGHHAEPGRVGGFCLFNNIAAAARHAQAVHGVERVLVVDVDVHHGNGTQNIFYDDPSVLFVSTHMFADFFYPGTGAAEEIGVGAGQGYTLNIPFPPVVGDMGYRRALAEIIRPKAAAFQPGLLLVSIGFDAHWQDPLASADLTLTGYVQVVRDLIQLAADLCQGRVLFVLEGGYLLEALSFGVLNTLYALLGRDQIEDPLGPSPRREQDISKLVAQLKALHQL